MDNPKSLEIKIKGMDCADCVTHVQKALVDLPAVQSAEVYLGAEKAVIHFNRGQPPADMIARAVKNAGYEAVFNDSDLDASQSLKGLRSFGRSSIFLFIAIVVFMLGITLIGERLGFLTRLQSALPWYFWLAAIAAGGWPVFAKVIAALLKKQIISHTLMTASALTAVAVGEWTTALLIVVFMRLGDFIEKNTTEKARKAVRKLHQVAPRSAHLVRNGKEIDVSISALQTGDIVQIKPGESIPVDGIVLEGNAFIDQAAITGESMAVEAMPGDTVYAASILHSGALRVRTTHAGKDSLFGRIIRLVEEAEANRGAMQSMADRFSSIYLPIVSLIALITYLVSGSAISAAAVMAVSCSCSFSLATPVAMLASIGTAAQEGILFKGGKYIEGLEKIDTVFIDKTGTLTLGQPKITDIQIFDNRDEETVIRLAASVERYSEHPLAAAVLQLADERGITLEQTHDFSSIAGKGVSAFIGEQFVEINNREPEQKPSLKAQSDRMRADGKTLLFVHLDGQLSAVLGAEDILRPDTDHAIAELKEMGFKKIILLSGDHETAVRNVAIPLGISFHAELLPQEKIALVKGAQEAGSRVMMIGDGVNDAPALAQADIGIAMGASGTDIAIETAHIVLLREDWLLIPKAVRIAQRTMRVVRRNIYFTAFYNLIGLALAAFGLLPPAIAAAMQSIPDVGIMANSARLLRNNQDPALPIGKRAT